MKVINNFYIILDGEYEPVWVFSMCDTSVSPVLGNMEIVNARNAATLLIIIEDHVQPDTVIWSDSWATFNGVRQLNTSSAAQHGQSLN